ncbi:hypothetical protein CP533_0683 [Ophiocordyceps camponoti-saundersi (nom. inval.)]|nr:hypothetical protein CP533_0683 [Ophiocordyceps camponoti-saundersi (nom. inval.)]
MAVTEFALLQLQPGYDEEKLRQLLARCRHRQDEWAQLGDENDSLSSMYLGHFDQSPTLLITAPWDSPEAHADWIRTEPNQACNRELAEFVRSVNLCHLEPVGRRARQLRGPFRPQGTTFNVHLFSVPDDRREALTKAYLALEEEEDKKENNDATQDDLWAGWRLEPDHHHQSLVVFWADNFDEERQRRLIESCDGVQHGRFRYVV